MKPSTFTESELDPECNWTFRKRFFAGVTVEINHYHAPNAFLMGESLRKIN
jgi:hypothetical protein